MVQLCSFRAAFATCSRVKSYYVLYNAAKHLHTCIVLFFVLYHINIVSMFKLFFQGLVFQSEKNSNFSMPFVDTVNCRVDTVSVIDG
jgi:hypothetical protein